MWHWFFSKSTSISTNRSYTCTGVRWLFIWSTNWWLRARYNIHFQFKLFPIFTKVSIRRRFNSQKTSSYNSSFLNSNRLIGILEAKTKALAMKRIVLPTRKRNRSQQSRTRNRRCEYKHFTCVSSRDGWRRLPSILQFVLGRIFTKKSLEEVFKYWIVVNCS